LPSDEISSSPTAAGVASRRALFEPSAADEAAAATKIQAAFRGHKARQQLQQDQDDAAAAAAEADAAAAAAPSWGIGSRVSALKAMLLGSSDATSSSSSSSSSSNLPKQQQQQGWQPRSVMPAAQQASSCEAASMTGVFV
jgi:hypothetical protein